MSSLTKVILNKIDTKSLSIRIENIHPDAVSLDWMNKQTDLKKKSLLLFRIMIILERIQREKDFLYKLYQSIFQSLEPIVDEEYGDQIELNKYTELSDYGSWILEAIADNLLVAINLVNSDFNNNWETGRLQGFNPYESERFEVPYVEYELAFKEELLLEAYEQLIDYSALGISCVEK